MKKIFKFWVQILTLLSVIFLCSSAESQSVKPLLKPGDPILPVEIKANLTKAEKEYLGVRNAKKFRLKDIQAAVIVVEYFNKYCPQCQRHAPIMNALYEAIQQDAELKTKVKMLGIGSGNNATQVELFKQEKNIPFPLIPDDRFILHDEVGRPKTPFTIFFKKTDDGKGIVSATSIGIAASKDQMLEDIRTLVTSDLLVLGEPADPTTDTEKIEDSPKINDAEFQTIVAERLAAAGEKLIAFERVLVLDETFDIVYKVRAQGTKKSPSAPGERIYFVRKVYRNTVCGNCHDAHFWYVFDARGKIINFHSIYLTKAYNKQWNESELTAFNKRIIGRSIQEKFIFNPKTDAVTAATITSSLIYDTLGDTKKLFATLKKSGAMN